MLLPPPATRLHPSCTTLPYTHRHKDNVTDRLQDLRVGNKYRIGRKIGSGSFGDIYLGKDVRENVHATTQH